MFFDPLPAEHSERLARVAVASQPVAARVAWPESGWVVLQVWPFADGIVVVEIKAVVCRVGSGLVVDGHAAQPADCVGALALFAECACFLPEPVGVCACSLVWHGASIV